MNKLIPSIIAATVVVAGGAFYVGMKYAEYKNPRGQFSRQDLQNLSPEERQQRLQQFGASGTGLRNGGAGSRTPGGFVSGEILSKDDKSITVKMRDGGSKIIFYSDTTEIGKFIDGALTELESGKTVSVNGTANSDGSITAQSIQLRPAMPSR